MTDCWIVFSGWSLHGIIWNKISMDVMIIDLRPIEKKSERSFFSLFLWEESLHDKTL